MISTTFKGEVIVAHNGSTDGSQAGQTLVAAGLSAGRTGPRYWRETACEVDLYDVKADTLLAAMGAPADNIQVTADPPASYHPGRAGASVVDRELPADTLLRAAGGVDRKLVTEISLFDVYEGAGLAEGKKSLAITVVLQPQGAHPDRRRDRGVLEAPDRSKKRLFRPWQGQIRPRKY